MKAFGAVAIIMFGLTSCGPLCAEKTKLKMISTDGKHVAELFERDCGATTGIVSHINLRTQSDKFNTSWTGTITDGEVFITKGNPKIELSWKDNLHLEIVCLECSAEKTFKQETNWNTVTISYRHPTVAGFPSEFFKPEGIFHSFSLSRMLIRMLAFTTVGALPGASSCFRPCLLAVVDRVWIWTYCRTSTRRGR